MTDRELLQKAAKAAGIDLQWIGEGRMAACFDPASVSEWWNPLTDDGDALRLAVKLRINIPWQTVFPDTTPNDEMALIRLAIVHAAVGLAGEANKCP